MSKNEKILVLNIATDSKDTSLGFAISWLNEFSKYYLEVDVITLNKGDTSALNENINIYEMLVLMEHPFLRYRYQNF